GSAVVVAVEAPGPLHGAGAEDQRAARRPVHREAVRGAAGGVVGAVVLQHVEAGGGGGGQLELAARAEAVVLVVVPLVADRAAAEGGGGAGGLGGHRGAAPEPHLAVGRRHLQAHRAGVDLEDGAGQPVLRAAAVGRRAEPRVAPAAGPGRGR